jgi:exodeoxyribonuclease V
MTQIDTKPQLNADQKAAVAKIAAFIVSDQKEFFLTGAPGVGKTFTTKELSDVLLQICRNYEKVMGGNKNLPRELVLTSTTNKAAAVLSAQTGHSATTIHSFLGVIPQTDFKTGKTNLKKTNNWQVHFDKLIFIDEASMIEKALYQLINEATDDSCKIIYIGDKNQLPPVMEKLSPAVTLSDIPDLHYEITTPVRNAASPALLQLCDRLRNDILNETPKDQLTNWPLVPGQIEYLNGDELQALINTTFGPNGIVKKDDVDIACRILAFKNETVIGYNDYIRKLRGLPEHPSPGEILICNTHLQLNRQKSINVEEEVLIHSIEGPFLHNADANNKLSVYKLTVSSLLLSKTEVLTAADRKEYLALLAHYKKHKDWSNFYKLQETLIDLRDREAATVYKAQGSTYDSVIMIMDDIFGSRDINQLRRMLYVGASRAKSKVYVYDKGIYQNARGIYR